ncbi:Trimethyllysine dioxygenase [Penicillium malachiteum]|uniref:Trimethyllysine dioxygenase n=1 Tax=Penicillium malachiteum TaxID=1324776 RepID=UPI002546EB3C|nr:Trimethyllysine dioxygenase [Penicillium malachiteum]KAJ5736816.1 Trimethyllysine dioxygenase [Penicillium malachiteum]
MNTTRAALIRPKVPLQVNRAHTPQQVSLNIQYAAGSRTISGGVSYNEKNRKSKGETAKFKRSPPWRSPEFTIPENAKQIPILQQFNKEEELKAAYNAFERGYVPLKRDNSAVWDELKLGKFFLRENCQCPKCIHPETKQRISDTFLISHDVDVTNFETNDKDVKISWTDGHESTHPWDWLDAHRITPWSVPLNYKKLPQVRPIYTPYVKDGKYPEVQFGEVVSDESAVLDWLWKIWLNGFCFIKGVPVTPEATKTLIERISFIRHTHYGGFWDFTADLTFKDTAYTNEFLGGHTDNAYFTDPARLQLFHLLSHTDGSGGESLLVDALSAANKLRLDNKKLFTSLIEQRHSWHSSGNEDVCIQPSARAPVLSVHPDTGRVYQVRWNNYDRAPKSDWNLRVQKSWYNAARRFNEILNEESRQIWTQLEPGTALIFDNWRMLHGRSEFTGKRRMCGGYINNDDFISRLRLLKYGREKVLNSLGTVPRRQVSI